MNIELLKSDFQKYLLKQGVIEEEDKNNASLSESIFLYDKEFKKYLAEHYDTDINTLSLSLDDISKMEVVDGVLVDMEEAIEAEESEEVEEKEEQKVDYSKFNEVEFTAEDIDNFAQQLAFGNKGEDVESQTTDVSNVLNEEDNKPLTMADILNEYMQLEEVKEFIDVDENGELNKEEVSEFLEMISKLDGDKNNISLKDTNLFFNTLRQEKHEENAKSTEEVTAEDIAKAEKQPINEIENPVLQRARRRPQVSTGSGSSTVSYNPNVYKEKTIETMNLDELNEELNKNQDMMKTKQDELSQVVEGSDETSTEMIAKTEELHETYLKELEKVDKEYLVITQSYEKNVSEKEKEIFDKQQAIFSQELSISKAKTAYANATSTRQNLEMTLSSLNSIDTSDMKESRKSELYSNIQTVKSKIESAKNAEEKAKVAVSNEEKKLVTLNEEKAKLEEDLVRLNDAQEKLENQIKEKYPEIEEYLVAYNESKEAYETYKNEKIATLQTEIQEIQTKENEIKVAINNRENQQTAREYSFNKFGEELVEYAVQFHGDNEYDGSADKFLYGASSSDIPWCGAFVQYVLENNPNADCVPDWYTNIENKWYCPNLSAAAEQNNAYIDINEVQPGDMVLFFYDGDKDAGHVGIVDRVENGIVYTVEGNSSNQVSRNERNPETCEMKFCKLTA